MSGQKVDATPNISLMNPENDYILLQEDKVSCSPLLQSYVPDMHEAPALSRLNRVSANCIGSGSISHYQFCTRWDRSSYNVFQNICWHCHGWSCSTFLQDNHHARPCLCDFLWPVSCKGNNRATSCPSGFCCRWITFASFQCYEPIKTFFFSKLG